VRFPSLVGGVVRPPAARVLSADAGTLQPSGRVAMKVGVLQFFSWPERRVPIATVYARALERIEVMDKTGYDAVWLAEHHFHSFSVCPSVHMMGVQVAARTQRLRIGTAVSLAAFYHPLRLAEEVALLDVLSGGRVNWGAGRGFDRTEFRAFGVPQDESAPRFQEAVDIVLQAWRSERLTYKGKFFQFEDIEVLPRPVQQPHPPVWLAASSPEAITRAAQAGFSIMMDPHSTHAEIARKRALYQETLAASGHRMAGREIPIARLLAIAKTTREAEDTARRGAEWLLGSYAGPQHGGDTKVIGFGVTTGTSGEPVDPIQRYLNGVIIHGTPETVTEELLRLRDEASLTYLLCAPLSHETFRLFTDEVLPRIASV
jgi:alkanesulfonate monooxygenase SsuD/methylene tetrahydromethanopterin reductase-like flavin-dependent oxidoreductase (luciferase family)